MSSRSIEELQIPRELKCFIVYSSRRHVDHINVILSQIEDVLKENNFKPVYLGDEIRSGEDYLEKLDGLINECVLGVIILDGLRPNVLFEFGYLKGKLKPTIILQSRGAQINIKTLYNQDSNLTPRQFKNLHNPTLNISIQFSDFAGKHVSYMDWRKHTDDEEHPRKVLTLELLKSKDKVLEETQKVYSSGIPPEVISELTDEILFISECYFDPSKCDLDELLGAYREIKESARNHRFDINIRVQNMVASTLAIKGENGLPDVVTSVRCWRESIGVYREIVEAQVLDKESERIGEVFFNIGNVYESISDVRDKEENLGKAIDSYSEALRIRTLEDFPVDYAMTQNNLGIAYRNLGDVRDKEENLGKAIDSYSEALRIYTLEDFPVQYATTQNNLGTAYGSLGDVRDKEENLGKAIDSYSEALRIRTLEDFPVQYATTQNNLGTAYGSLGDVRDKEENLGKAIDSYSEALKIYTEEKYPARYKTIKNILNNIKKLKNSRK